MKKIVGYALPVLTLALLAGPAIAGAQQYGQQGYPQQQQQGYPQQQRNQQGYGNNGGQWDAPPSEFNDLNRRAFRDGMEAARSDFRSHRPMNPQRNPMFRRPPAPRQFRDEYRNAFSRGYQVATQHRDRWQNDNGWRPR